jgi:2-polyprenyl-6-methoxyphenol hydroxylase-like FAD-dependent oxidoreductase
MVHSQTRPLLEHTVRGLLAKRGNVRVLDETRLLDIRHSPNGVIGGPVTGVEIIDKAGPRTTMDADLVVEALGRSGYTGRWLTKNLGQSVPETELGIDLVYTSALLHRTPSWRGRNFGWVVRSTPPNKTKTGVLIPMEDNRWMMTLSGRFGEVPPNDQQGFMAYAAQLEDDALYQAAAEAEFATPITAYRIPRMIWRHYDRVENFPDRLIPLGDTIAGFNPLAAQGMSVAALQAIALRDVLRDGLAHAASRYMTKAMQITADAWSLGELIDFAYPQARGHRPDDLAQRLANRAAIFKLAASDPEVRALIFDVQNMLKPPSALYNDDVLARANVV